MITRDKVVSFKQNAKLLGLSFTLGEKNIIHDRRVYDSLQFLGDAGGIAGSMTILGMVIHFIITGNE